MEATRPAWGCLDAREIQGAASGQTDDPAIRKHLADCEDCRGAVRELRGVAGHATGAHDGRYRRSLLARPGFWLLLAMLGGLGYGFWKWNGIKSPPPAVQPATVEALPVAAPPPSRPKMRRIHPPHAGSAVAADPGIKQVSIAEVIRRNQTGVRMCYERALKRESQLSVLRVDVRLNVSPAGVVDKVALSDLPDSAQLSNCIRNTIRTWKFSPATAGYETTFSLHLHPGE
jgi:hypothetical protein